MFHMSTFMFAWKGAGGGWLAGSNKTKANLDWVEVC